VKAPEPPAARPAGISAVAIAALIVLLAGLAASGQAAQDVRPPAPVQEPPSFRTGVELVSLNVTVTEGTRYVPDLEAGDFQVFEDGVHQDITYFSKANLPIALALLIDTSASMESRLHTAQEAAIGFARRLRPQDLAEVVDFDSRVIVLQPFSNDIAELEQAIRKTSAGGSTSLHNALYVALKNLRRVVATSTDEIRRQAIVLLSDGEDTSSLLPFEEVLDLARRSETAIYAIGLRSEDEPARSGPGFNEADFVLRQLAQETGGRAYFAASVEELSNIYGQISDELSSQYTIGYTSRNTRRDGAFRRVVVRVNRPGVVPRAKLGYFAPAAP
jgi:Ca-activated chloride channel family protein